MARAADNDEIIDKGRIATIREIRGVKLIVGPVAKTQDHPGSPAGSGPVH